MQIPLVIRFVALASLATQALPAAAGALVEPAGPAGGGVHKEAQGASRDAYVSLAAEWEGAMKAWHEELRLARKHGNSREVRARRPTAVFYERFEALSKSDGRALLWCAMHVHETDLAREVVEANKKSFFARLIDQHLHEPWIDTIVPVLAREKRWIGEEGLRSFLQGVLDKNTEPETRATAGVALASRLQRSKLPAERDRALAIFKRVAAEFPKTRSGPDAAERAYKLEFLTEGRKVPNLQGVDAEGKEFALSDYRGKIVVLEFWGFW